MDNMKRSVGAEQDVREVLDKVRESAELYRSAIENIVDPVFVTDARGDFTFIGPNISRILGYSVEELEVMGNISACVGEGRRLFDPDELYRKGEIHNIETAIAHKDGSKRDYLISVKQVSIKGGSVLYTCRDITEHKQAEAASNAHIRFLESLERIDRVIKQEQDAEQMLWVVVKAVFEIFDCDRAWLLYPCDPDGPSFRVPVEITKPEFPGAGVLNVDVPMSPGEADCMREALASDAPVIYVAGTERPIATAEQFAVQSQMFVPLYPKLGKPWVFGMHQCSSARVWTGDERKLFKEISRRISDGLSSALYLRELQENEERFRATFEQAAMGIAHVATDGRWLKVNQRLCEIVGYSREELL